MAKYQKFENLPVWREGAQLYNRVLDLLEEPNVPLSPGYRNQLDRAALSVSNNIAEGFERVTTNELNAFLAIARGSAGEVRSMMAVVQDRPKLKPFIRRLQEIRALAESCAKQLTAWTASIERSSEGMWFPHFSMNFQLLWSMGSLWQKRPGFWFKASVIVNVTGLLRVCCGFVAANVAG